MQRFVSSRCQDLQEGKIEESLEQLEDTRSDRRRRGCANRLCEFVSLRGRSRRPIVQPLSPSPESLLIGRRLTCQTSVGNGSLHGWTSMWAGVGSQERPLADSFGWRHRMTAATCDNSGSAPFAICQHRSARVENDEDSDSPEKYCGGHGRCVREHARDAELQRDE